MNQGSSVSHLLRGGAKYASCQQSMITLETGSPCGLDHALRSMAPQLRAPCDEIITHPPHFGFLSYLDISDPFATQVCIFNHPFCHLKSTPLQPHASQKPKLHTRSVRPQARVVTILGPRRSALVERQSTAITWYLRTCLHGCNGEKHQNASTRRAHVFPASTWQTCCHRGLGSPWKSSTPPPHSHPREFFPAPSAKTSNRNSSGVPRIICLIKLFLLQDLQLATTQEFSFCRCGIMQHIQTPLFCTILQVAHTASPRRPQSPPPSPTRQQLSTKLD